MTYGDGYPTTEDRALQMQERLPGGAKPDVIGDINKKFSTLLGKTPAEIA